MQSDEERPQYQCVGSRLKSGTAKRSASKAERDERRQNKGRKEPKSVLQQKQG